MLQLYGHNSIFFTINSLIDNKKCPDISLQLICDKAPGNLKANNEIQFHGTQGLELWGTIFLSCTYVMYYNNYTISFLFRFHFDVQCRSNWITINYSFNMILSWSHFLKTKKQIVFCTLLKEPNSTSTRK